MTRWSRPRSKESASTSPPATTATRPRRSGSPRSTGRRRARGSPPRWNLPGDRSGRPQGARDRLGDEQLQLQQHDARVHPLRLVVRRRRRREPDFRPTVVPVGHRRPARPRRVRDRRHSDGDADRPDPGVPRGQPLRRVPDRRDEPGESDLRRHHGPPTRLPATPTASPTRCCTPTRRH